MFVLIEEIEVHVTMNKCIYVYNLQVCVEVVRVAGVLGRVSLGMCGGIV